MKASFWCDAILDGKQVRVRVMHLGSGKYRILEDESGVHDYKVIDASDIVYCDTR